MEDRQQPQMSSAGDTPPNSPVEPHNPVTKPSVTFARPTSTSRIFIDDEGVHDFDFRRGSKGPKKLTKFSRRSLPHQRSSSAMSDIPERKTSNGSDTASIRKRISSFIPGNDKQVKNNGAKSLMEATEDPMPETKQELEHRLNYHLAELDILKRSIRAANEHVRQLRERYAIFKTRPIGGMNFAFRKQEQMIEQARENRDSYGYFVMFHRAELERIKQKRWDIETNAGLQPTLPEVYKNLWGDEEWAKLFSI